MAKLTGKQTFYKCCGYYCAGLACVGVYFFAVLSIFQTMENPFMTVELEGFYDVDHAFASEQLPKPSICSGTSAIPVWCSEDDIFNNYGDRYQTSFLILILVSNRTGPILPKLTYS